MGKRNHAPKYRSAISDCNFSFCMHYSEKRRRCALRKCFYDRKNAGDEIYISKRKHEVTPCRE